MIVQVGASTVSDVEMILELLTDSEVMMVVAAVRLLLC